MQSDELATIFTALPPSGKATFLIRVAHEQTIHARAAYLNYASDPSDVDATALRRSNEFIHKLCGYALQCLRGSTTAEQDASFVAMIVGDDYPADDLRRCLTEAAKTAI
jgi:hypothetical protein